MRDSQKDVWLLMEFIDLNLQSYALNCTFNMPLLMLLVTLCWLCLLIEVTECIDYSVVIYTLVKSLGLVRFFSHSHQGCVYLIKNTAIL